MTEVTPLLFLFGLAVGTFGTMLGVGGGFIHVPFLMLVFGFSAQDAVADSLAIIFLNTLTGSLNYYYQKRMDFDLAMKLAPALLPGAIIGPLIVEKYTNSFFFVIFSAVLFVCAINLYFGRSHINLLSSDQYNRKKTIKDIFGNTVSYSTNVELGWIGTFVIGFVSNLVGIGGGVVHVPFLILFMKVPTHLAVGTSHLLLCISSGVGAAMFLLLGRVNVDFTMAIGIGAVVGAPIGASLSRRSSAATIRKGLAILLVVMGIKMVFQIV